MRFVFPVLALLLLVTASVLGQQATRATLTGVVTDPNGAVVPGVTVTATQTATGMRRQTVSNEEGLYVLTDLAPGEYEIRVEAKGLLTKVSKAPGRGRVGKGATLNHPLELGFTRTPVADVYTRASEGTDACP